MKELNDTLVQIQKELSGIRNSLECIALASAYSAGIRFGSDVEAAAPDIKDEEENTARNNNEINLTVHVHHYGYAENDSVSTVTEDSSEDDKELDESYRLYIADMECD